MPDALGNTPYLDIFVAGGLLIFAVVVLAIILSVVKRKYDPRSQQHISNTGFMSMDELEELSSRGLISDEEFDMLRKRLIAISGGAEKKAPSNSPGVIIDNGAENDDTGVDTERNSCGDNRKTDEQEY